MLIKCTKIINVQILIILVWIRKILCKNLGGYGHYSLVFKLQEKNQIKVLNIWFCLKLIAIIFFLNFFVFVFPNALKINGNFLFISFWLLCGRWRSFVIFKFYTFVTVGGHSWSLLPLHTSHNHPWL